MLCELKDSMKALISIKNSDNKRFLWCHIRHLNPLKSYLKRITKADKKVINDLDYDLEGINLPVSRTDFGKIEKQDNICINVSCYVNNLVYAVVISDEKSENCMDLFLITDGNNSNYVYIKDFNKFMFNKTKHKNEKHFSIFFLLQINTF